MDEANLFLDNHRTLVRFLGVFILFVLFVLPGINSYFSADSKLERKVNRERRENELKMQKEERLRLAEEAESRRKMERQEKLEEQQRTKQEEFQRYSDFMDKIRQTQRYQRWKDEVKEKCGNNCQIDKSHTNRYAEVHHLVSLYKILKQNNITSIEGALGCRLLWDTDNGVVLCKECHDEMESSKNRQAIIARAQ